jgi:hypothetical protein
MVESEKPVDDKYIAEGWLPFAKGWPDRAYVRMNNGKLEVRFVEIKGPTDTVDWNQEVMHMIMRSPRIGRTNRATDEGTEKSLLCH